MAGLAEAWYTAFMTTLQRHEAARPLQAAVAAGRLGDWTQALTGVVVDVGQQMGWETAARWHRADVLPIRRSEYLALDAVAFEVGRSGTPTPWPFPVAVFELENSRQDDQVAYSLWKVLCVRTRLRVVFCYRQDVDAGSALVRHLADAVVGSLPIQERVSLVGETLLVVGNRAEESTFPYGFFKDWVLDQNTGRFSRI
ncbi:MAG: hypothetical protein KKA73_07645 [Chloroflexi bacterium]|nr:hypothetical protein [Chloroflexota bacterium]